MPSCRANAASVSLRYRFRPCFHELRCVARSTRERASLGRTRPPGARQLNTFAASFESDYDGADAPLSRRIYGARVVAQSRGTDQRLASRRASVHQLEDALPRHCTPSRLSAANEDAPHSVVRSGARRSLLTRGRPPSRFFCSSTAPRSSHARAPLEGQRSTRRSRHDYRPPRACACLTSRHPSIRISSLLGGILN